MIQVITKYGAIKAPAPASSSAVWGTITGTVTAQTDLTSYISSNFYPLTNPSGYISGITSGMVTTALGYTPEDVANKQNSLTVDGTGFKYPTVDAVNVGLATKGGKSTLDNLIKSGVYMPHKLGYASRSHTAGINGLLMSQKMSGRDTCIVTSLSVWCLTGVAGGNVRLAIYSDLNGLPNTLIIETGNIACTSSGLKEGAISATTLNSGTVYHVAYQVSSGTISLQFNPNVEKTYYDPTNFYYAFSVYNSMAYAAMPATFPAITYNDATSFNQTIYLKQQ
jgi:hypothetical protein